MKRSRGNAYKLHQETFHLGINLFFFTVRTINHWHNIPRGVVESPSLEVFKMQPDGVPQNLT